MTDPARRDPYALGAVLLGLVGLTLLALGTSDSPGFTDRMSLGIILAFALAIVLGEFFQLSAPGYRGSAPIASAAALGLAYAVEVPANHRVAYASSFVLLVIGGSMTLAALARYAVGQDIRLHEMVGRFVAVTVATVVYRSIHLGQQPGTAAPPDGLKPWQQAVLLLTISLLAIAVEIVVTSLARAFPHRAGLWRAVLDQAQTSFAVSIAIAVTGVLIAIAVVPLGVIALPLFLVPLVLTQFAFRRYVSIRATYLQSIRTLSRLTDASGYTPAGHSERVAALARSVGRSLGLTERAMLDLEYAALLHDIGQVALVDPIPGGATVLAAPADQRRIEADTVAIVRETGVLESVAVILEHQTTPYRRVRELGEEIPLASRIIKVCNAYDDLTGGHRGERARDAAVERIYLGLGYEYDPGVVDALLRVLRITDPVD
ncbi:MAG: HD domain-containing phosphohydrolase [Terracoccus sp.]